MDGDNKLIAIREHLRIVLKLVGELGDSGNESPELKQVDDDVRDALRALKEHGDAGDWVS